MSTLNLPINAVLAQLLDTVAAHSKCILQAPPGAGKTTQVPLALLAQPWLAGKKILLLEPRRLAVRTVAQRLAEQLHEPLGKQVGYRMRLDTKVSAETRIEVVTEGVLLRQLQADPSLSEVGIIIFDEFHERSLNADLALAFSLSANELFCQHEVKLLFMSATLDQSKLATALQAPVVESTGRSFPVDIIWASAWRREDRLVAKIHALVERAVDEQAGSILVFLPGQAEIGQLAKQLADSLQDDSILIAPLYGDLSLSAQRQAIAPSQQRKIVLATNIAETSLTIEGISVVVDSGFERRPIFDPNKGITRLALCKISKASAQQRAGRAGRLSKGVCYRLWSAEQHEQLEEHAVAEILQADLSSLALSLFDWGATPDELFWLDKPPAAHYQQAVDLLVKLQALEQQQLTAMGRRMADLPMEPRLARLLLAAQSWGQLRLGAQIVAILTERDFLNTTDTDLQLRINALQVASQQPQIKRVQQLAKQFEHLLKATNKTSDITEEQALGALLAVAFPERIAQQREGSNSYKLANGRGAYFAQADSLQKAKWLVVADMVGQVGRKEERISLAAELDPALFNQLLAGLINTDTIAEWQTASNSFVAQQQKKIGQLVLATQPLKLIDQQMRVDALLGMIRQKGLEVLPFTTSVKHWQARVLLLRGLDLPQCADFPDVSSQALLETLEQWLAPYIQQVDKLTQLQQLDLLEILQSLLSWEQSKLLDELAPSHYKLPTGSNITIDYSQQPPVLAVRLQELFGVAQTPCIANGQQGLKLHLLSPAHRPVQVTMDLASFWQSTYFDVKKDLQGRYPKHYWPDNPLQAEPTSRAKRRT
ncbi:ATP-dependent helicase HrpB [Pseudomonas sp. F1_0610]|uniref:ATP-dependent helicase HrpB n=1 Tax=Pseudomonas sp. F1_0610 TaxID=3114284 RepID=UPI0039C3DFC2